MTKRHHAPILSSIFYALLDIRPLGGPDDGRRNRPHHALLYIQGGSGELKPEGEAPILLNRGRCIVLAPGTRYQLRSDQRQKLQGVELLFDGIRLTNAAQAHGVRHESALFPYTGEIAYDESGSIGARIDRLLELHVETDERVQLQCQREFLELLDEMWDDAAQRCKPRIDDREGAIQRTMAYMEQAYDQEITRELLAGIAGMSPGYYSSVFRKEMGRSPMDMLAEIRMEHAKRLLLTSDYPLRQIAQAVGYSSEFYFSSRFKQVTGLSPSSYVQRNRGRKLASSEAYTTHLRAAPPTADREAIRPQRIVGLFLEDHLTVLGVKPLMQYSWSDYYQRYLSPYLEGVEKLDMGRPDFEQLRRARPDVILLGFASFAGDGRYDRFAEIAPTYVFQQAMGDWRETLHSLGSLIGREAEAKQAVARYEVKVQEARELLSRKIGRETVAVLRLHFKDGLCLYGGSGGYTAPVLYEDLGLAMPQMLCDWRTQDMPGVMPVKLETVSALNADHLFLIVDEGQEEQAAQLMRDPSWSSLSAVGGGRVYVETTDVWMTFGIIAHERKIEHVLNALLGVDRGYGAADILE